MQYLARKSFAIHLLDALTANIAVLDSQGEIISVNRAWKRFARENNSNDKSFYVGTNYLSICENAVNGDHDESAEIAFHGIQEVVVGGKDSFQFEYPCNSPSERRWFTCRVTRLEHKGQAYIVVLHENITARKEAEQALAESYERFQKLTHDLPDAIYTLNLASRQVTYFNHDQFLGYTRSELMASSSILQKIYPEDAPAVMAHWQKVMRGEVTNSIEYRLCNKAGEWEWIESRETITSKERDEKPSEIMVILTTITERKRTEEQIQYQFKLLENVNDAIFCTDENFLISYWNRAAERIFGWKSEEVMGHSTVDVLKAEFSPEQRVKTIQTLTEIGQWKGEIVQYSRSGEPLVFEANVMSMRDYQGKTIYVAANREITKRKRAEEELRRAKDALEATNRELQEAFRREQVFARTDSLTGIFNRRHFFDLAEQEFVIAKRYRQTISVIIFDVDHFKQVNDTFGHQVGDEILQSIVRIARENLREADIFARHGGEEFIILLANSNAQESQIVAERIRKNIAASHLDTERGKVNVTVSIGIAELSSDTNTIDHLVKYADQALYKAKEQGRNRTMIYSS